MEVAGLRGESSENVQYAAALFLFNEGPDIEGMRILKNSGLPEKRFNGPLN